MISTIPVVFVTDSVGADWRVVEPGSVSLPHLQSAMVISLLTDRRADRGDALPDASDDRRGVWFDPADGAAVPSADWIGSRIWLVSREKATEAVRRRVEDYCREALAWLTEDGVASSVDVSSQWSASRALLIEIKVNRVDGDAVGLKFEHVWSDDAL